MTLTEYNQLKQQVMYDFGTSDRHGHLLSTLKDFYKDDINSSRRFEQISTIGQLLRILEIRDVLSEDNVSPLKEIARRLNNNLLLKKINDYDLSHVPREYVNFYGTETLNHTTNKEQEPVIYNHPYGTLSKRKIQRINETIIEEIGSFWRDLGRNLKIRECVIEEIDSNNHTLANKALKLMEVYEYKADPQRWFYVLCEALERTRRKDLSKSLQEVMTMNI